MKLGHLIPIFLFTSVVVKPAEIWAHAVVTETSLRSNPVGPQKSTTVVFTFNSNIELSLSTIVLVSQGDLEKAVFFKPGARPGQVIILLPPLAEGQYTLRYKVLAADGHLTEGLIHFNVNGNW